MLRHTVHFLLRPDTTPEQQLSMLKGLAHLRFQVDSVRALDYGSDLFEGSREQARRSGRPCNYDVALMLDFADEAGFAAYEVDTTHAEVSAYNASITELTARVDWHYDGEPRIARGHVRHSAMFVWADDVDHAACEAALARLRVLESEPGVESLEIGRGLGTLTTDFDFVVDIHVPDRDAVVALIEDPAYADAMASLAQVTKYESTARISHVMRGV